MVKPSISISIFGIIFVDVLRWNKLVSDYNICKKDLRKLLKENKKNMNI